MSAVSSVTSMSSLFQMVSQASVAELAQAFAALGNALQSGELTSARNALAAFQLSLAGGENAPTGSNTQPFGGNGKANTDLQDLINALQYGNLSAAQSAFSSLQNDLKIKSRQTAKKGRGGHSPPPKDDAESAEEPSAPSATTSTSADDGSLLNVLA